MRPLATVVLPITGDRGALLRYSLRSILEQTIRELEVFIIGDGVAEATRRVIAGYAAEDQRVRFFDHPKHERRGEEYRHSALTQEARGDIVCYLCDRDYMLRDHVKIMLRVLEKADFCHTLRFAISPEDSVRLMRPLDLSQSADRVAAIRAFSAFDGLPLSVVGHTLAMYKALPFGWRTTPKWEYTDHFMWTQFLRQPGCRAVSCHKPTILYFPRGEHPGWPVEKRLAELERWHNKMQQSNWADLLREQISKAVESDWVGLGRRERSRLATRLGDLSTYLRRRVRRSLGWPQGGGRSLGG